MNRLEMNSSPLSINPSNRSERFHATVFGLYLAMLLLSAHGLVVADWTDHLDLISNVVFFSAVSGAALARSRFSIGRVRLFSTIYGVFAIGMLLGQSLDPALSWPDKVASLIGRAFAFGTTIVARQPSLDPLMFVLMMAILYWYIGTSGTVALLRRGHLWRAMLPPGLVLVVNTYYSVGRSPLHYYVGAFLILVLLMFMHHDFSAKQDYWLSKRIKVPYGLKWDLTRASGVATFLLVLAAWGGPVFARSATVSDLWTDVSGPWLSVRARLSDLVASLRSPIVYVGDTFGPTLQLSAGVKPNDSVVMVVDPSSQLRAGGRFYWQARTYSNYENGEWSDSSQLSQDYTPTPAGLAVPDWQARQAVDVTFYPRFPALSRLYLAAGTNWVNRSGEVWYSTMGGPERDVTAFISRPPVHDGEAYLTHASVAVPTASQLELAGKDYPSWVREAYLQVPNSLTDRFRTLARNITSQAETPYDQAEAVTAWLRNNIEYSRVTESPPEGREPLDWFVFDYKVGFCNFYASSEVMMLRTLGVPTRLSVGYAAGTPKEPSTLILGNPISKLDFSSSPYEVRGNDAHAWPEVFFPGYGWVPFEPTTSQPEIRRGTINAVTANGATLLGERDPLSASTGPNPDAGKPIENGRTAGAAHHIQGLVRQGILRIVLAVLLLAALLVAVALRIDPSWNLTGQLLAARSMARLGLRSSNQAELDTLAGGSPAARRYAAWTNWLPKLGVELKRSQTPFERLSLLVAQLPEAEFSSRRIVEGFAAERFGGQAPSPREEIERTWSELHRLFWETYLSRLGGRLLAIVQDPQRRDVGRRQHLDVTMGPR